MYPIQPTSTFTAKSNTPFCFKQDLSSVLTTLGFSSSESTNSTIITPGNDSQLHAAVLPNTNNCAIQLSAPLAVYNVLLYYQTIILLQ